MNSSTDASGDEASKEDALWRPRNEVSAFVADDHFDCDLRDFLRAYLVAPDGPTSSIVRVFPEGSCRSCLAAGLRS